MYRIGIDVGSTFTKYCIMQDGVIKKLFMEKTPIRQREYFEGKTRELLGSYPRAQFVSCGYGRENAQYANTINELTALAKGCYYVTKENGIALDIGGQDTKIILQENGALKKFFVNDKCAAGSGMFLKNTLDFLGVKYNEIDLTVDFHRVIPLSTTCAVFAQSEIVGLVAENKTEKEIISAVLRQIILKAKPLLEKMDVMPILLTGGISSINGIAEFAEMVLERKCIVVDKGPYLSAIGCVII